MNSTSLPPKVSRHGALAAQIRERILSGEWEPGERLPSFAQLRAEYGVAPTTVDRIYAVLEQEGLIVRQHGRGVFVARRQPALKGILGLVVPNNSSPLHFPYWVHLLEGIQSVAHSAGFQVLMLAADTLAWEKIDGILIHSDGVDAILRQRPASVPAVSLMIPTKLAPAVVADDVGGTREIVEHLLALGHRRIGTLMLHGTQLPELRLAAYYAALMAAGVVLNPQWIRPLLANKGDIHLRQLGRLNMQEWLQQGWQQASCTALLVQNDHIARGVIDALTDAGIKVPQEVSVVGFDGVEDAEGRPPRLTSVGVPLHEIGAVGTQLLLDQLQGADIRPHTVTLPTRMLVRETTAPPPA